MNIHHNTQYSSIKIFISEKAHLVSTPLLTDNEQANVVSDRLNCVFEKVVVSVAEIVGCAAPNNCQFPDDG